MGATVGPVDTTKFASDLEDLWGKFNKLDPEAMLASSGGFGGGGNSAGGNARYDEKAEQEATGFLLDLVSVSEANGLKLPRGEDFRFDPSKQASCTSVPYQTCGKH